MGIPSSPVPLEPMLAQGWTQLDAARRQQAIALGAQMAVNVVTTQPDLTQQEINDVHPPEASQAP